MEHFATNFDSLSKLIPGRSDYRVFTGTGYLVAAFLVVAQLASDGAVELVELDLVSGLSGTDGAIHPSRFGATMYHKCINPLRIEGSVDDSYVRLRSELPQLSAPERYETTPETRPNAPL